ncbi:fimbrial isopeptide formation D2 family protein/LPXTG-motif cell wall-anchored protein [Arcanobacterium pluranimalium]|uniref:SpaH/EbpB family LPXTG-anchored major pilin n=1 Tax=Arcanobacterium pluranimalium TaxID=108028 RepID=UPI001959D113|nr:SpaH/EbpB family LPXTG-anchored major pilin [Arcanobacterium pluranimalium]MBM7824766.1 fimbrial isopeptide formation D2 family protein/LPXTG-motif cell wall-anchored protein [Arcanobacterium pluranimalium]
MKMNFKARLAAVLGIVAVGAASLAGVSTAEANVANIQAKHNIFTQGTDTTSNTATTAAIENNRNGTSSLTIHKYAADSANPAQGQPGTGAQISDPTTLGTPLQGVQFRVTRVDSKSGTQIDLATNAGWDAIRELNGMPVATAVSTVKTAPYVLGTQTVITTDAQGVASLANQNFGLYLVEEIAPGNNNITAPVQPFLATLPLGNGSSWNYDVHVYPKNTLGKEITKVVSDPVNTADGPQVTWTIDSPIPASTSYTKAQVVDDLDSRLTYVANTVQVTIVDTTGARNTLAPNDFTVDVAGQRITVTLVSSGLGKMVSGGRLQVDFATIVKGSGIIPNTVNSYVNDSVFQLLPTDPNNPDNPNPSVPTVYWGTLKLLKVDAGNNALKLAGAQFGIYNTAADAASGTNAVGTYTTNAQGEAVASLYIGQSDINGTTPQSRTFYVKELAAPAGYVLDATVRTVALSPTNTETAPFVLNITNEQEFIPGLPLTGSQGTVLMIVVGTLLVASGVGFAMYGKRRKAAANAQTKN